MRYQILLCKYPNDGLLLALRHSDAPLVVSAMGDGRRLGWLGVAERSRKPRHSPPLVPGQEVMQADGRDIVFCAPGAEPCADVLDEMRRRAAGEYDRAAVVVTYDRLEHDLPRLLEEDEVTCWWDARDLLSERALGDFRYLSERLALDAPRCDGLRFYVRDGHTDARDQSRLEELYAIVGPPAADVVCIGARPGPELEKGTHLS